MTLRSRLAASLALIAYTTACSDDTTLLISIDSDLNVPAELDAIAIEMRTPERLLLEKTYPLSSPDDLPATLSD